MYRPRELVRLVRRALKSLPVVVVTGMRQVGKSTMLLEDPEFGSREYRTLEDHADFETARRVPEDFLGSSDAMTVDEVQLVPGLLSDVKRAVDRRRRPGRYLLSGSSNLLLLSNVTESLAGRALYVELMPMTRRELRQETEHKPFIVEWLESGKAFQPGQAVPVEAGECLLGGMPPVAVELPERELWFRGFEQTYLERDVRSLAHVGDLAAFRNVLRALAARPGGILNLSDVARDIALSLDTVRRYVGILEASFCLHRLPAWRKGRASRLAKSPKVYIADSGIASWLVGLSEPRAAVQRREWGPIVETYVLQNIRGILSAWLPEAGVFYWREHGRYEVDFVVEDGDRVLPIEVKWASKWTDADLSGLRKFLELHPRCKSGVLACRTERLTPLGNGLFAVPLGLLLA